ncbi:MAG: hypothetical protein KA116_08110 [Proteobacteria bacterium]|nr:hypothetical protein [Pseudomonadota bacterium]
MNSLAEIFPELFAHDTPPRLKNWSTFCSGDWLVVIQTLKVKNLWTSVKEQLIEASKRSGIQLRKIPEELIPLAPGLEIRFETISDTHQNLFKELKNTLSLPVFFSNDLDDDTLIGLSILLALSLQYRGPLFLELDKSKINNLRHWPEPLWTQERILRNTRPRELQ